MATRAIKVKSAIYRLNSQLPRVTRIVGIGLFVWLLVSYLEQFAHSFDVLDEQYYGICLEVDSAVPNGNVARANSQIQVVAITSDTFKSVFAGQTSGPFLPRRDYAELINKLTSYGAKVIVIDQLFDLSGDGDSVMANSIRKSGKVLLGCSDSENNTVDGTRMMYPEACFQDARVQIGHTRVPISSIHPWIDEIEPVIRDGPVIIPALSVEAARMYLGIAAQPIKQLGNEWTVTDLPVTTVSDGANPAFKIRYLLEKIVSGSGDLQKGAIAMDKEGYAFQWIDFWNVIHPAPVLEATFRANRTFKNKIVIIGDVTEIHGDYHNTPVDVQQWPGVEIQANAVSTVLNNWYIHEAPGWVEPIVILIFVVLTALLSSVFPLKWVAVPIILVIPTYLLINICLFVYGNLYLQPVAPSLALILTAPFVLLERATVEENEKSKMRGLLERYVNPRIANHILKNPDIIGSGGKRDYGTVLFTDIRGFTRLSEELKPEELVGRMNEYFEIITEIIYRHDGTAACIVGDAMLAVFGIPVRAEDHADRAVAAAIEIEIAVRDLGKRWNPYGHANFSSGIGINTGQVIIGEIGGKHLRNFTVYGLNVNIAARVEALNKEFGTKILITRATKDELTKRVSFSEPRMVTVKGVVEPVEVYALDTGSE